MTFEPTVLEPSVLRWFKSSYSSSNGDEGCVETAASRAAVHVRDSKQTDGPQLAFPPAAWTGFVSYTRG